MVQWLHISDLHFQPNTDPDQESLIRALLADCRSRKIQADFVAATGDFHNFWDTGNYLASWRFLHTLMEALGLDITRDLFLVPGNHDVNPVEGADPVQAFLTQAQADCRDLHYACTLTKHGDLLNPLLERFRSYRAMAGALLPVYGADGLDPAGVHVRPWRDRLNILHLNTALLSNGERDHMDAVDLGAACSPAIQEQLKGGLPTLVLGHHSFHDLHPTVKDQLVQLFNQSNVWGYLAGDKHRTNYQGDTYLIDRKAGVEAWPNLVASKLAAAADDSYSEFGVVHHRWDEHSTVQITYWNWEPQSSGTGLTPRSGRTYPMCSDLDSELYYDLAERLTKTRSQHPSFQLMEVDENLFPEARIQLEECQAQGSAAEAPRPLAAFFQESWSSPTQNHLMLEGEGGIGKTVALLSLTTREHFLPRHVPAVYIPLHALRGGPEDDLIGTYIQREILEKAAQFQELEQLARRRWEWGPRLVLLLDGFNEIPPAMRYAVSRSMEDWARRPGVQVITASRFDVRGFLPGLTGEFRSIRLQPLTRERIRAHLERAGVAPPPEADPLWTVIDYPLMLVLYARTQLLQARPSAIPLAWRRADSAGAVLWNYLQQELWRCQSQTRNPESPALTVLATECLAPRLAWSMVRQGQFRLPEEAFYQELENALAELPASGQKTWPDHVQCVLRRTGGLPTLPPAEGWFCLLTQQLNLFRIQDSAEGPMVSLMHQRFRDCLAAIHLLNLSHSLIPGAPLPEAWQTSIDVYVMDFTAELATPEEAARLWEANRTALPTSPSATRNMLELQKRLRNYDFSQLNFSGMDLQNVHLFPYHKPGSTALLLPKTADFLHKTQVAKETFAPEGHSCDVTAVAVTADGQRCVSASGDGTLRIWDMGNGSCLRTLVGHTAGVTAVSVTADGRQCVSASFDNTLRIWDMRSGSCLHTLEGRTGWVNAVFVTADGRRCVSASHDGTLRIWDMSSCQCLYTLVGHAGSVNAVSVTADGQHCVSASEDGTLRIWDIGSGKCLHTLKGHTSWVSAVSVTADGWHCISASFDDSLRVWGIGSGKCLHTLEGHTHHVNAVSVTPDGQYCVSASSDRTLRIWDIESGKCLHMLEGYAGSVYSVSVTADGQHCVSTSDNRTLRVWDMGSERCLHTLEGHTDWVNAVSMTTDGRRCVSASADGTLRIWDMESGKCLHTLEGHTDWVNAVSVTADGRHCVSASADYTLRIWDMESGKCLHTLDGHTNWVDAVSVTADGRLCISISSDDRTLRIWGIENGKCLYTLDGHTFDISSVSATADGQRCVSASGDRTLRIWDIERGKCLRILDGHTEWVKSVSVTADGRRCVSASADRTLRIWDMESGKCLHTLNGHTDCVRTVSVTADGRRCVSASHDGTLRIWDMGNGKCLHTLEGHSDDVNSVSVTADGRQCISASNDGTLRIWNMDTGRCLKTLHPLPGLTLFGVDLSAASITPPTFAEVLRQNGARVPPDPNASMVK